MSVSTSGGSAGSTGARRHHASGDQPVVQIDLRDRPDTRRGRPPSHRPGYTKREHEILELVAAGHSNAEIARALGISRRTVEKHLESIHAKAGTATRARLVAYALSVRFPSSETDAPK